MSFPENRPGPHRLCWNKACLWYENHQDPKLNWEIRWQDLKTVEYLARTKRFLLETKNASVGFPEFESDDAELVMVAIGKHLKDTKKTLKSRPVIKNTAWPFQTVLVILGILVTVTVSMLVAQEIDSSGWGVWAIGRVYGLVFLVPAYLTHCLLGLYKKSRFASKFPDLADPHSALEDFFQHISSHPAEAERFFRHLWSHTPSGHLNKWTRWACRRYEKHITKI